MNMIVKNVVLIALLTVCSVEDILRKEIHLILACITIGLGIFCAWIDRPEDYKELLYAFAFLAFLILFSFFSHEKIGMGDAILSGAVAFYFSIWDSLLIFWIACMECACIGGAGLALKKLKKGCTIPFIPCLLTAVILNLIIGELT